MSTEKTPEFEQSMLIWIKQAAAVGTAPDNHYEVKIETDQGTVTANHPADANSNVLIENIKGELDPHFDVTRLGHILYVKQKTAEGSKVIQSVTTTDPISRSGIMA